MNGHASNICGHAARGWHRRSPIEDDGRGIPVDKHPTTKKSALEVIFTVLHAGGKFEHGNYKTAGGLHGVGASVVNALSKELVATVKRDGAQWEMRFKQGKPVGAAEEARRRRAAAAPRSTSIPTRRSSRRSSSTPAIIQERLEVASYLHKGLKITFEDEGAEGRSSSSSTAKGSSTTCKKIVAERGAKPVHDAPFTLDQGRRAAARSRAAVDRGDRRARPLATSTASRPDPAARTRTACAPASARRSATSSTRTTCRRRA